MGMGMLEGFLDRGPGGKHGRVLFWDGVLVYPPQTGDN